MKLTTSLLKGGVCYLLSLALLLWVVTKAKTHLRAGEQVDYGRSMSFFLKASEKTGDHYAVTSEMAKEFEKAIGFKMNSATTFQTTSIEVKPQDVSWKQGKTEYVVSGGRITFAGKLKAEADPLGGEQPLLIVLPELRAGEWAFPNGGARGLGRERIVKEFRVHPSAEAVQSANWTSAAKSAGAPALLAWGVWLMISAARVQKARHAASEPVEQVQLPRTFAPNGPHIANAFGIAAMIGGIVAMIFLLVGLDDPGSSLSVSLASIPAAAALAVAILVAWIASRGVVGAEVSVESLVLSRGGRRREIPWPEIETVQFVQLFNPSGKVRKEYLEVAVRGDRKPLRIGSGRIAEYPLFRDLTMKMRHGGLPAV